MLFLVCIGSAMSSVFELSVDPWVLGYSVLALLMLTLSLVLMERLHVQQNCTGLELIYMNSFNCLCLFLIADIVQVRNGTELREFFMMVTLFMEWGVLGY